MFLRPLLQWPQMSTISQCTSHDHVKPAMKRMTAVPLQTTVFERAVIGIGPTNRHHNDGWCALPGTSHEGAHAIQSCLYAVCSPIL